MKWKEQMEKYFAPLMNTKALLLILLLGVLFLVLAGGAKNEKKEANQMAEGPQLRVTYAKELEERLASILSTIKGAGKVSVMVTLSDEGESIYAQNSASDKKPNGSGTMVTESRSDEKNYVLKNDAGGGQSPISVRKNMPTISGVLVTAQGAEDETVKSNLILAIKSVLDVKAHRVQVFVKK